MSKRSKKAGKRNAASAQSGTLHPLYLLDDEPIANHLDDLLDLRRYADLIAGTALGTTGPFTIGVYADWGHGKTSLLKQARSLLDQPKVYPHIVTVLFNAWRYEQEEHAIVPLVAAIERAVDKRLEENKTLTTAAWEKTKGFFSGTCRLARGVFAGFSVSALGAVLSGKDVTERIEELKAKEKEDEKKQWDAWVERCLYLAAFDRLDDLCRDLFRPGAARPEDLPRIVVFIDDLDRCLPERAFRLLESIKLVLAQKGFVFVLALNEGVVNAYLSRQAIRRYGSNQAWLHQRYLDKIVQLPLLLPPHEEQFTRFVNDIVRTRLKPVLAPKETKLFQDLSGLLALGTQYTPRTLVRRINALLVDMRLRGGMKIGGDLGKEKMPFPRFVGLCLVQRTLQERLDSLLLRKLREDQKLCSLIRERGVPGARKWLAQNDPLKPRPAGAGEPAPTAVAPMLEEEQFALWKRIVDALNADELKFIRDLLEEPPGQDWLDHESAREAVSEFVSKRPEPVAPAADAPTPTAPQPRPAQELGGRRAVPLEIPKAIEEAETAPPVNPNAPEYWITIPAGKFTMGSQKEHQDKPNYDAEANESEFPHHEVHHKTYQIGRYPLTVAEYQRFVENDGYANDVHWKVGGFSKWTQPGQWDEQVQYPNRPVTGVSWYEAKAYAAWAGCRLLSEAEWERAARGLEGHRYPWGKDNPTPEHMNYVESKILHPTPVGVYPRGATVEGGIHDMAGNVWEWCEDVWHGNYKDAPNDGSAWTAGAETGGRVLRGGSWYIGPRSCRAASRNWSTPDGRGTGIGFRVASGT